MRINIYSEEMTTDWEWVERPVYSRTTDKTVIYWGLRIYLKSAPELHSNHLDDDRSAITFWSEDQDALKNMLRNLS